MSLLKNSKNCLLTRAAQKHAHDFATSYRAVTVRERSAAAFFSSLMNAYSTLHSASVFKSFITTPFRNTSGCAHVGLSATV